MAPRLVQAARIAAEVLKLEGQGARNTFVGLATQANAADRCSTNPPTCCQSSQQSFSAMRALSSLSYNPVSNTELAQPSSSGTQPLTCGSQTLQQRSFGSGCQSPAQLPSLRASGTTPATRPPLQTAQQPLLSSPSGSRWLSNQPEHTVYSGPSSPSPKRVTQRVLRKKYEAGEPISMVTAYDYPSAVHVDEAGMDMLLVGDSAAMVVHGHDTTLPITLDEMISHCRAVSRGAKRPLMVGDLPFGSYEGSPQMAVASAVRILKEGNMDAIKLEGANRARIAAARAIVDSGIAVMGHTGLIPQAISVLGGFRPQGQSVQEAVHVIQEAKALEEAGCFAIVLECIPPPLAAAITASINIPTIGIGAGPFCSGQVLVYHDLLGMMQHPHHAKVTPKFCKQYAAVGALVQEGLQQFRQEVSSRAFPSPQFSPYKLSDDSAAAVAQELHAMGHNEAAAALDRAHISHSKSQQALRAEKAAEELLQRLAQNAAAA